MQGIRLTVQDFADRSGKNPSADFSVIPVSAYRGSIQTCHDVCESVPCRQLLVNGPGALLYGTSET
eukprot:9499859-Pyramimonas_sp.AAC.1